MTKHLIAVLVIWLIGLSSSFAGSDLNMKEGNWEITTKMEMTGMPMQIPPQTHTQCITKKDLVPQNTSQQNEECKMKDMKTSGNSVSWTMECDSPNGKTVSTGKITYSGDTMKGVINIKAPGNMTMTSHISGKRIGPCQ